MTASPTRLAGVLLALFVAACQPDAGSDGSAGGADGGDGAGLPPCADGDPCTLETRTEDGCVITGLAPACVGAAHCCRLAAGAERPAGWRTVPCADLGLVDEPDAACDDTPTPATDTGSGVCCELAHPDGGLARFLWSYGPCTAAGGQAFVSADCTPFAAATAVCCAYVRGDGVAVADRLPPAECAGRSGAVAAGEECERANAPVCCALEGAKPDAPRTLVLSLAECAGSGGTGGPAATCDPACERPCADRACGPDGCGGSCGACTGDLVCTAAGTCELTAEAGGTVCCERLGPDDRPRRRWLALREDCPARGGEARPLAACDEPPPDPPRDDVCCEWTGGAAACAAPADCGSGACVAAGSGSFCGAVCETDGDCAVDATCRPASATADDGGICQPLPLWWPPDACAASGGAPVDEGRCPRRSDPLICCTWFEADGTARYEWLLLSECHDVPGEGIHPDGCAPRG